MNKFFRIILCTACCASLSCAVLSCRESDQKPVKRIKTAPREKLCNENEVRILLKDGNTPEMILADYAGKMTYDGITYLAANGLKLNPELIKRTLIKGSLPAVTYILEQQIHSDNTNGDSIRLMNLLFRRGLRVQMQYLIIKGVKPTGEMFLSCCAQRDHVLVRLMLESGISANTKDQDQTPALHVAVAAKDLPIVKMLVEAGADLTAKDKSGKTAIDLADTDELRQYFKSLNTTTESK